jgi:NAD(P)-dependent dehydrogenase (short-subunit alcohol dehydrogenase family)
VSGPDLSGRCAIVTGASRGIGLAVAHELVRRGAGVVMTGRRPETLAEAAAGLPGDAVPFPAHAADPEAAQRCVDFALERFGRLDILINNAGTNPSYAPVSEVSRPAVEKTFEVNFWGVLLWSRTAWAAWMAEHGGAIVNVSSLQSFISDPDTAVYASSKAAQDQMTAYLALEFAPNVRVNTLTPGLVRTRLAGSLPSNRDDDTIRDVIPLGRIGEPSDVAAAAVFLASDMASWITGTTLIVDGGMRLVTGYNYARRQPHGDGGEAGAPGSAGGDPRLRRGLRPPPPA